MMVHPTARKRVYLTTLLAWTSSQHGISAFGPSFTRSNNRLHHLPEVLLGQQPHGYNRWCYCSRVALAATLGPSSNDNDHRRRRRRRNTGPSSFFDSQLFPLEIAVIPFTKFIVHSFLVALLVIAWEDVTCSTALPSRHRTEYLAESKRMGNMKWGQSTVRGMGFGYDERMLLNSVHTSTSDEEDTAQNLPSYNEILWFHRTVRVPQWRRDTVNNLQSVPTLDYSGAIHTLCQCLESVFTLKQDINNYQWDSVRTTLKSQPWSDLEWASSRLRSVDEAVGFDWGSCAWRGRCNAWADAQEAMDELDFLLGVLEPYEALFCLDIIERSLRDMLVLAPWEPHGQPQDVAFWNSAPPYQPHRIFDAELEEKGAESERIDDEYLEAMQALRIE